MKSIKTSRIRRAKKARMKIRSLEAFRLTVHKTSQHMYAQIISPEGDKTCVSASTLDKDLKDKLKCSSNVDAAAAVGKLLAERAIKAGVKKVAFDRSGFKYHGRVKALAEAARESGIEV